MKPLHFLELTLALIFLCPAFAAPNPSVEYCTQLGYLYEPISSGIGQQGICRFSHETDNFCDAWALYDGECGKDKGSDSVRSRLMDNYLEDIPADLKDFSPANDAAGRATGQFRAVMGDHTADMYQRFATDAKTQGECGSCWAFATAGALESAYGTQYGQYLELSEQDLVSCSFQSCSGGSGEVALNYVRSRGIVEESVFPYNVDSSGNFVPVPCSAKKSADKVLKIDNWGNVPKGSTDKETRENIKNYLKSNGPLIVLINSVSVVDGQYKAYTIASCQGYSKYLPHAVLLTGYLDTGDPKTSYWTIKNSWGPSWGNGDGKLYLGFGECSMEKNSLVYLNNVFFDNPSSANGPCTPKQGSTSGLLIYKTSLDGKEKNMGNQESPYGPSYVAFTDEIFGHLEKGKEYPLEVYAASTFQNPDVKVWIDYSGNGDFAGSTPVASTGRQNIGNANNLNGNIEFYKFSFSIKVPDDAKLGNKKMRIILGSGVANDPCQSSDGETQDYVIDVMEKSKDCGPIDASLTLPGDVSSDSTCFKIQENGITIDCAGHTIKYAGKELGYAIDNPGYKNVVVKNCVILQDSDVSDSPAIMLGAGSDGFKLENTKITTKGARNHAVRAKSSSGISLAGNTFDLGGVQDTYGAYLDSCPLASVKSNTINLVNGNTNAGIFIHDLGSNTKGSAVESNTISFVQGKASTDSGAPTTQFNSGIVVHLSDYNTISSNTVNGIRYWGWGIENQRSDNSVIKENNFNVEGDSAGGIRLSISKSVNAESNRIFTKGKESNGITVAMESESCTIAKNAIELLGQSSTGIYVNVQAKNQVSENTVKITDRCAGIKADSNIEVSKNTITGSGDTLSGIGLLGNDNTISGNTVTLTASKNSAAIYSYGKYREGLYDYSKGNQISKNTVSIDGSSARGIYFEKFNGPTKLDGNIIKVTGNGLDTREEKAPKREDKTKDANATPPEPKNFCNGIDLRSGDSLDILGNTITVSGDECVGIQALISYTLKIKDSNKISAENGNNSWGISLLAGGGNEITNNEVTTSGNFGTGLNINRSQGNSVKENKFDTKNGYALYLEPSTNKTYYRQTIADTNTEQGKPIYYHFEKKDLEVRDKEDVGQIYIVFCDKPKIEKIKNSIDGITIVESNQSAISDCNLTYDGCNVSGIFLIYMDNATINNSVINASCENTAEVTLRNATNISFVNTTYSNIYFHDEKSALSRYWYLDVNITNSSGQPIEGADVLCRDSKSKEVFNEKTDSQGMIKQKTLLEYNQTGVTGFNPEGKKMSTPYLIEATKETYNKNSTKEELTKSAEVNLILYKQSS